MRTRRSEKRAASLVAIACVMVVALATPASAATLVGDYQFQDTLGNSAGGSAAALTEFSWYGQSGSFVMDTVLGENRTVWDFPEGTGLVLNGANQYMSNQYSIVMFLKLDEIGGWRKLVDFRHSSGNDSGLYVLDSNLNAYGCGSASSTSNPIDSGTYQQIVMTRDSSKRIRLYVNGSQVAASDDTSDGCSFGSGSQLHFFVDDAVSCSASQTSCEQTSGAIARLRLYNGALTSAEVAALDTIPGAEPPPGQTHDRTVSLNLRKHLIAKGTVAVPDGFSACAQGVTVVIKKKTSSGFKAVGSTVTTMTGTYKKKIKDKPGVYQASVALTEASGGDICGAASSLKKRHKH